MKMPEDKKMVDNVPDDEPGKEVETEYDRQLRGPRSGRMKPLVSGDIGDYGKED